MEEDEEQLPSQVCSLRASNLLLQPACTPVSVSAASFTANCFHNAPCLMFNVCSITLQEFRVECVKLLLELDETTDAATEVCLLGLSRAVALCACCPCMVLHV